MTYWLIMTRGAPGSGKSTFLRENGLAKYTVNPDFIRAELGGLYIDSDGTEQRGFVDESEVWKQVESEVRQRMEDRQHVIIDATFQQARDFRMPAKLIKQMKPKFRPMVLDFTGVTKDVAKERNSQRDGWARVPEKVIDNAYQRFKQNPLGTSLLSVPFDEFLNTQTAVDLSV